MNGEQGHEGEATFGVQGPVKTQYVWSCCKEACYFVTGAIFKFL